MSALLYNCRKLLKYPKRILCPKLVKSIWHLKPWDLAHDMLKWKKDAFGKAFAYTQCLKFFNP